MTPLVRALSDTRPKVFETAPFNHSGTPPGPNKRNPSFPDSWGNGWGNEKLPAKILASRWGSGETALGTTACF